MLNLFCVVDVVHTNFTYVDVLSVWQRLVMLYAYEEHPLLLLFDFVVLFSPVLLLRSVFLLYYISFIYIMYGSEQRSSTVSGCVLVPGCSNVLVFVQIVCLLQPIGYWFLYFEPFSVSFFVSFESNCIVCAPQRKCDTDFEDIRVHLAACSTTITAHTHTLECMHTCVSVLAQWYQLFRIWSFHIRSPTHSYMRTQNETRFMYLKSYICPVSWIQN